MHICSQCDLWPLQDPALHLWSSSWCGSWLRLVYLLRVGQSGLHSGCWMPWYHLPLPESGWSSQIQNSSRVFCLSQLSVMRTWTLFRPDCSGLRPGSELDGDRWNTGPGVEARTCAALAPCWMWTLTVDGCQLDLKSTSFQGFENPDMPRSRFWLSCRDRTATSSAAATQSTNKSNVKDTNNKHSNNQNNVRHRNDWTVNWTLWKTLKNNQKLFCNNVTVLIKLQP